MTDPKFNPITCDRAMVKGWLGVRNQALLGIYSEILSRRACMPEGEQAKLGLVQVYAFAREAAEFLASAEMEYAEDMADRRDAFDAEKTKEARATQLAQAKPWDTKEPRNVRLLLQVSSPVDRGIDPQEAANDVLMHIKEYQPENSDEPKPPMLVDALSQVSIRELQPHDFDRLDRLARSLSVGERRLVMDWCLSILMDASDQAEVVIPQRPSVLNEVSDLLSTLGRNGPVVIPLRGQGDVH